MTLQFPRYSRDGKELARTESPEYSCSSFFRLALKEYFKPLFKGLSPDQIWELVVLLHNAYHPAALGSKDNWDRWTASVNELTGILWTKESAAQLTEDYIARMFPLLERPQPF